MAWLVALALATWAGGLARPVRDAGTPVTTEELLDAATDLGTLARTPKRASTLHLASSREPSPDRPAAPRAEPLGWFANTDHGHFLRVERRHGREERVLMEATGPGAIVRLWFANAGGRLRIYLDDLETPALDADLPSVLRGGHPDLPAPFAATTAGGGNLDFPLPFRQEARVTVEAPPPRMYFQVLWRAFDAGTDVVPWRPGAIAPPRLAMYATRLREPQTPPDARLTGATLSAVAPSLTLRAAPGGSEIVALVLRPSRTDATTLRATRVSMAFDGVRSVDAPLGDLFGGGPGFLPHRTLALEVTPDGRFICRFVMPFVREAVLAIAGPPQLTVAAELLHRARPFAPDGQHFHAEWRRLGRHPVRPFKDLTIADLRGAGTYVGTALSVRNESHHWWGEGDEKLAIDDDVPRWLGTGTEDYFGFANSSRDRFDHPFRTQALAGDPTAPDRPARSWRGYAVNARLHVLDAIAFSKHLRFDFELWHWDAEAHLALDAMTYSYLRPEAR